MGKRTGPGDLSKQASVFLTLREQHKKELCGVRRGTCAKVLYKSLGKLISHKNEMVGSKRHKSSCKGE